MTAPASSEEEFQRGMEAARSGELDRAIELWTSVLEKDPKSYAAHVNRGTAYLLSGYVLKGVDDWHKAWRYAPVFAYGYYSVDFIDQESGNTRMLTYAKPLELDPDHIASVTMMGITCLELGRPRLVVDLYRKSIDLTKNPMLKSQLQHWIKSITSGRKN
jgi:tetratricopeptide (TPR) repeat protein